MLLTFVPEQVWYGYWPSPWHVDFKLSIWNNNLNKLLSMEISHLSSFMGLQLLKTQRQGFMVWWRMPFRADAHLIGLENILLLVLHRAGFGPALGCLHCSLWNDTHMIGWAAWSGSELMSTHDNWTNWAEDWSGLNFNEMFLWQLQLLGTKMQMTFSNKIAVKQILLFFMFVLQLCNIETSYV